MSKVNFFIPLLLFPALLARAQEKLALNDAIALALKNNYAITISRNEAEIEKNNYSYGNAGFLPQVNLLASGNLANNDTRQHYASGLEVNKSGVGSNAVNSGVALTWTLFDGMKMFVTYQRLKELSDMGELQAKVNIENTVAAVISSYFNIVKEEQLIRAVDSAIVIYEERVRIAEMKLNIGSGSKLDVLQAKVDLNAQKSAQLKEKALLVSAKAALNQLLAREADTDFEVSDSLSVSYKPQYDEIKKTVEKRNTSLLLAEKNISVYDLSLKETRSLRYPRLAMNLNYNFSRSENQAGFVLLNQNLGLNAGFTASWTIFNGFNTNRQVKNAALSLLNAQLGYSQANMQVSTGLLNAFTGFQNALALLKLEEDNYGIAQENVNVALESFRIGKTSSLELKEAQKSFEDAQARLVTARYSAKLAETELMRLAGMLVK